MATEQLRWGVSLCWTNDVLEDLGGDIPRIPACARRGRRAIRALS